MHNKKAIHGLIQGFYPYAKSRFGFDKPCRVFLHEDAENAANPLGKTAYYDPDNMEVHLYISGRHPKDILRSFSHELVHHAQNCRGEFDRPMSTEEGYAQEDDHLRKMEMEAYLEGCMGVRDYEDQLKAEQ